MATETKEKEPAYTFDGPSRELPDGDSDHYIRRALAAYWRTARKEEVHYPIPSERRNTMVVYDDHFYVVLANTSDILAMYRVKNDGALRRLRRYPASIKELF